MVGPWIVVYAAIDFRIRIPSTFGTELPYRPVGLVLLIEELDQSICGIAVCAFGVRRGGTGGGHNYMVSDQRAIGAG